jgi:hypothetical protein
MPSGGDGVINEEGNEVGTPASEGEPVSLQAIVVSGLGSRRLHLRRGAVEATVEQRPRTIAVAMAGGSMRVLETGLALTALATALLIGLGR